MNYENITLQDCLDNFVMKGKITIVDNGQVSEAVYEEN